MDIVQILSFIIGILILSSVIFFIVTGRLKERYAILWIFSALFICILSISRKFLEYISLKIGIYYPPSLLFLAGVLFLLAINISFSVTISKLSSKVDILAQEIALLKMSSGPDLKKDINEG